jgi:hypothetical protein
MFYQAGAVTASIPVAAVCHRRNQKSAVVDRRYTELLGKCVSGLRKAIWLEADCSG